MLSTLNQKKLRNLLLLFFIALLIPTIILIVQSYDRLKWETFHQYQSMADELSSRIDQRFLELVNTEESRPFTDYSFLNVAGEATANFFQRSPLSHYPVESDIPGVIGYFQVDVNGQLMTPLLPQMTETGGNYGIAEKEFVERVALQDQIRSILHKNSLLDNKAVAPAPVVAESAPSGQLDSVEENEVVSVNDDKASSLQRKRLILAKEAKSKSPVQSQQAFDNLNKSSSTVNVKQKTDLGRVEDLSLTSRFKQEEVTQKLALKKKQAKIIPLKRLRTEKNVLPEAVSVYQDVQADLPTEAVGEAQSLQGNYKPLRISTFESEIDPFEFSRLDEQHFMLFRKVWRNDQRYIQGILIRQQPFLENIINTAFRATALSQMSDLLVSHQGNVLQAFSARSSRGYLSSARELNKELLYQSRLSAPFSDMQLLFSVTQLPAGAGDQVLLWLAFILLVVLCAGFYLLYRLGVGQINLLNQQQDFVSAVSHELKTPLTSIRMYGEMLREGWASEEKKKTYYDFIFDESERLTRLINNVLLMAKLTRNRQQVELKQQSVSGLIDAVQSKVSTQISAAGFAVVMDCEEALEQLTVMLDADWFSQIMINLVDNALKFSAKADKKQIDISCRQLSSGSIQFKVRDYGPGVPEKQMKKIFKLFYRTESELTRETVGTGIGLSLVHQMISAMNGRIDVVNSKPGAEFIVTFPLQI